MKTAIRRWQTVISALVHALNATEGTMDHHVQCNVQVHATSRQEDAIKAQADAKSVKSVTTVLTARRHVQLNVRISVIEQRESARIVRKVSGVVSVIMTAEKAVTTQAVTVKHVTQRLVNVNVSLVIMVPAVIRNAEEDAT